MGKDQIIITKRKRKYYLTILKNYKLTTYIEAVSTINEAYPTFIILTN